MHIYDSSHEQESPYIVMELVPGLSLGTYINQLTDRNQVIRLDETLLLTTQVAEALGYAHRKGVLHQDIKPDNILVKESDQAERPDEPLLRAVVTDFGLAKLKRGDIVINEGEVVGTLDYMSPGQLLGQPVDGRSDIYSLGVVLFQLATGQLRYDNYQERWGKQAELERFLQGYAAEKALLEARRRGHSVTESKLADGSIKLTIHVGGAAS
mgnify:CR=1 FL=1